jgi:osmotically-inducible protein OsmY
MKKRRTDLKLEVQRAISDDSRTREHGIEVLESNGVITLKGQVPSVKVFKRAKTIALNVPGVAGVINALEIHGNKRGDVI